MKKINNKGFTLIELLAVLVILTAIMTIAIPTVSSSLERNKVKQDEARKKLFVNAAELYVSNNKNRIFGTDGDVCYITLEVLENEDLLSSESLKNSDGKRFSGVIMFNKIEKTYEYTDSGSGTSCVG